MKKTTSSLTESKFKKAKCWGLSAAIDIYGCDPILIKTPKDIERFVIGLCKEIKMKRHGKAMIERFAEGYYEGVSMMQFIETSSITAHFEEQESRAFIDVFSCRYFSPEKAGQFCKKFFKANKLKLKVLVRN
jgi:S-adenosylmethionine/arginine decarboxylase-like enzyme